MSKKRAAVTVRIAGEEHTIRANAEPEYTLRCARLVDDRMQEIRAKSGLIETHKAAILAAMSIADEYFQAVGDAERTRRDVASRAAAAAQRLEEALATMGGSPGDGAGVGGPEGG